MTEQPAVDIVKAYQDAWTKGDLESARQYLADGVVFQGPGRQVSGPEELITVLRPLTERIEPRWELIAATPVGEDVLIVYNLFMRDGSPAICADYFKLKNGKIESELLAFDPKPFAAGRQAA